MPPTKEVMAKIKIQCPGGQATPAPPVGPALGPHGVNIGEFVKRLHDPKRKHELEEAVKLVKGWATTKFDQSVEVVMKLGLDPKKSEQNLRGSVALPKGIGKTRKVIVFADGAEANIAKELGADEIGMED